MSRPAPAVEGLAARLRAGDRAALARAVTLLESSRPQDRPAAAELVRLLAGHAGGAHRIGVSGPPGAGKSTFIDALGSLLGGLGHRVAVLAVDPSSVRTGGSILGDSTRMVRLAAVPGAYLRPSPSRGALGGVTASTADTVLLVEAAGYDVVLVETVGVGQSETAVAAVVDSFLLVTVAGTGDGLQGIKRGVLEFADLVVVNKADGAGLGPARQAAGELASALRLRAAGRAGALVPVLTCSARDGSGVPEIWQALRQQHADRTQSGVLARHRRDQQAGALWPAARDLLLARLAADPRLGRAVARAERAVAAGELTMAAALQEIVAAGQGAGQPGADGHRPRPAGPGGQVPAAGPGIDVAGIDVAGIDVLGIDHVGVAVPDLDEAITRYGELFGLRCVHREENAEQGVQEAMLQAGADPAGTRLQLLAPSRPDSPIARFLDRRGPGLQQLALRVADIEATARILRERGVELLYPQPRRGTAGSLVNFVHPRDCGGVLLELVQPARRTA